MLSLVYIRTGGGKIVSISELNNKLATNKNARQLLGSFFPLPVFVKKNKYAVHPKLHVIVTPLLSLCRCLKR